jgi:predicted HTH domain antitoxin
MPYCVRHNLVKKQMQITIDIPEAIGQQLTAEWGNVSQRAKEALAVEAYRTGSLTSAQVQSLLNLSSLWEVEEFFKKSQAYLNYTESDLEQDRQTLNNLLSE